MPAAAAASGDSSSELLLLLLLLLLLQWLVGVVAGVVGLLETTVAPAAGNQSLVNTVNSKVVCLVVVPAARSGHTVHGAALSCAAVLLLVLLC
jgi:hypothetical protein